MTFNVSLFPKNIWSIIAQDLSIEDQQNLQTAAQDLHRFGRDLDPFKPNIFEPHITPVASASYLRTNRLFCTRYFIESIALYDNHLIIAENNHDNDSIIRLIDLSGKNPEERDSFNGETANVQKIGEKLFFAFSTSDKNTLVVRGFDFKQPYYSIDCKMQDPRKEEKILSLQVLDNDHIVILKTNCHNQSIVDNIDITSEAFKRLITISPHQGKISSLQIENNLFMFSTCPTRSSSNEKSITIQDRTNKKKIKIDCFSSPKHFKLYNERMYVATESRKIVVYDRKTGKEIIKQPIVPSKEGCISGIGVSRGVVWVGTGSGKLFACDATTLKIYKEFKLFGSGDHVDIQIDGNNLVAFSQKEVVLMDLSFRT